MLLEYEQVNERNDNRTGGALGCTRRTAVNGNERGGDCPKSDEERVK